MSSHFSPSIGKFTIYPPRYKFSHFTFFTFFATHWKRPLTRLYSNYLLIQIGCFPIQTEHVLKNPLSLRWHLFHTHKIYVAKRLWCRCPKFECWVTTDYVGKSIVCKVISILNTLNEWLPILSWFLEFVCCKTNQKRKIKTKITEKKYLSGGNMAPKV